MSKIAEALFEITLPRFSGDVFPRTDVGIVLAVADRYVCTQNYPIPDIEKITCMLHLLILLVHTQILWELLRSTIAFRLSKNVYKLERLLPFNHLFHRLDSLVGLFGAGCQPSSTNDPFGLRRVSYGLVRKFEKVQMSSNKIFLYLFYLGPNIG